MAKKKRSIGAFVKMILGDKKNPLATVTIHGKSKKQARARAHKFFKRHLKNVSKFDKTPKGRKGDRVTYDGKPATIIGGGQYYKGARLIPWVELRFDDGRERTYTGFDGVAKVKL